MPLPTHRNWKYGEKAMNERAATRAMYCPRRASVGLVAGLVEQSPPHTDEHEQQEHAVSGQGPRGGQSGHRQPSLGAVEGAEGAAAIELPDRHQVEQVDERAELGQGQPEAVLCHGEHRGTDEGRAQSPDRAGQGHTRLLTRVDESLLGADERAHAGYEKGAVAATP